MQMANLTQKLKNYNKDSSLSLRDFSQEDYVSLLCKLEELERASILLSHTPNKDLQSVQEVIVTLQFSNTNFSKMLWFHF
jgi:hypothetical protein